MKHVRKFRAIWIIYLKKWRTFHRKKKGLLGDFLFLNYFLIKTCLVNHHHLKIRYRHYLGHHSNATQWITRPNWIRPTTLPAFFPPIIHKYFHVSFFKLSLSHAHSPLLLSLQLSLENPILFNI